MRIAIAPNAFRGSLTAQQAVGCISDGLLRSRLNSPRRTLELLPMPLADGGDGTLDVILDGMGGEHLTANVTDPLGAPITATYGYVAATRTAVIEMARSSGVELIARQARNPLLTTSYGSGELINAALARGAQRILIGMGGSATVEGAAGCLQALGVRLLDRAGADIPRGGAGLAHLARIEAAATRQRLAGVDLVLLSDVSNPLVGERGAARVFGPQKGATPAMVEQLDANLAIFAAIIQRDLGVDVLTVAGGGAAGGFGAGLVGCVGATLLPGGATIIDLLGYEAQLAAGVDLILTGEGKLDSQTVGGKAVQSMAEVARRRGIPVVAFAGVVDADAAALAQMGIQAAWSIVPGPCALDAALQLAPAWLAGVAEQLGNTLALASVVR
jgi:glycerate kinase